MVAKPGKFQIMFLGSSINDNNITFIVENKHIESTNKAKLLRITVDQKLTFTKHINNLCNTASNHLRALTRVTKYLSQEQTKCLSEAHIMKTFKYCPPIWSFCGKTENKSINKIHKLTLRLIYETEDATFEDLLESDKIRYYYNIRTLLVKIYKSMHYIIPQIMWNFFDLKRNKCNLRGNYLLKLIDTSTCRCDTQALGKSSL